jgi:hypothetical protein
MTYIVAFSGHHDVFSWDAMLLDRFAQDAFTNSVRIHIYRVSRLTYQDVFVGFVAPTSGIEEVEPSVVAFFDERYSVFFLKRPFMELL